MLRQKNKKNDKKYEIIVSDIKMRLKDEYVFRKYFFNMY